MVKENKVFFLGGKSWDLHSIKTVLFVQKISNIRMTSFPLRRPCMRLIHNDNEEMLLLMHLRGEIVAGFCFRDWFFKLSST